MSGCGNENGRPVSNAPSGSGGDAGGEVPPAEKTMAERLAALLDDDAPAPPQAGSPDAARTVAEMRAVRAALRAHGPARAPDGFEDSVVARAALERERGVVVRMEARRDRVLILVQAASLAALLVTYAAVFGASRIHDVGPRWRTETAGGRDERDVSAALQFRVSGFEFEVGGNSKLPTRNSKLTEPQHGCLMSTAWAPIGARPFFERPSRTI